MGTPLTFHLLCSLNTWLGLGKIEALPGSCREGYVGQRGALLWIVGVKAVRVVHLDRNSLGVSLGSFALPRPLGLSSWRESAFAPFYPRLTAIQPCLPPSSVGLPGSCLPTSGPLHLLFPLLGTHFSLLFTPFRSQLKHFFPGKGLS
jgi:hypothetical protein